MSEIKECTVCGVKLTGGLDEYGLLQYPLCRNCWYEQGDEVERQARSNSPARPLPLGSGAGHE